MYDLTPNSICAKLYDEGYESCYKGSLGFVDATYVVLVWLGSVIFGLFGGVGLIIIPFELFCDFLYRPKPIDESEFKKCTKILQPRIIKLRAEGKKLEDERIMVEQIRGFSGFIKRY